MKILLKSFSFIIVTFICFFAATHAVKAVDTVVVGQPFYGYSWGGCGGGCGQGPYYPGQGYYSPNPVLQGAAVGGNPYFLGRQVYLNRGSTTRNQVRNTFRQSGAVLLTPNPLDNNFGYGYGLGGGSYYNGYLY